MSVTVLVTVFVTVFGIVPVIVSGIASCSLNILSYLTLSNCILLFLGHTPECQVLSDMVREAPGPLNFTTFLGLFGDKLKGLTGNL